jgi:hypothetical protein
MGASHGTNYHCGLSVVVEDFSWFKNRGKNGELFVQFTIITFNKDGTLLLAVQPEAEGASVVEQSTAKAQHRFADFGVLHETMKHEVKGLDFPYSPQSCEQTNDFLIQRALQLEQYTNQLLGVEISDQAQLVLFSFLSLSDRTPKYRSSRKCCCCGGSQSGTTESTPTANAQASALSDETPLRPHGYIVSSPEKYKAQSMIMHLSPPSEAPPPQPQEQKPVQIKQRHKQQHKQQHTQTQHQQKQQQQEEKEEEQEHQHTSKSLAQLKIREAQLKSASSYLMATFISRCNCYDSSLFVSLGLDPELWEKWMTKLKARGFFEGFAEGSEDYGKRYTKAAEKFVQKTEVRLTSPIAIEKGLG